MTRVHPSYPGQSVLVGQVAKEKGTEELAWALRVSSESCPWKSEESWGLHVLLRKNCSPENLGVADWRQRCWEESGWGLKTGVLHPERELGSKMWAGI